MKRAGDYYLKEVVKGGKSIIIYSAIHLPSGEKVTIYEYIKDSHPIPILDRLKEEIKLFKLLRHKSVLEIIEFIETEKAFYIVYEFILYRDVMMFVNLNYFNVTMDSFRLHFIDACRAVEQLHNRGYLHGDLRTESFAFSINNKMKFKDLRSCREIIRLGDRPDYVYEHIAKAKDIWSLGQMFRLIMTEIIDKNISVEVDGKVSKGIKAIPPDLDNLLDHMMDPNPVSRITMECIWKHPWLSETIRSIEEEEEIERLNHPQSECEYPRRDLVNIVVHHYSLHEEAVISAVILKKLNPLYSYYFLLSNMSPEALQKLIVHSIQENASTIFETENHSDGIYIDRSTVETPNDYFSDTRCADVTENDDDENRAHLDSHKNLLQESMLKLRKLKQNSIEANRSLPYAEQRKEIKPHKTCENERSLHTCYDLSANKSTSSGLNSKRLNLKLKLSDLNNDLQIRKVKPFSAKRENDIKRSTSSCGARPIYEWKF